MVVVEKPISRSQSATLKDVKSPKIRGQHPLRPFRYGAASNSAHRAL